MNKITWLTTSLVVGIAVIVSYGFLGDSEKLTQNQQKIKTVSEKIKPHSANLRSEVKPDSLEVADKIEQNKVAVEDDIYVRQTPPPPISSNYSKEVSYHSQKSHGHEEVSGGQKENAPPPPVGANQ